MRKIISTSIVATSLLASLFLVGCNSSPIPDQSVFEPLSEEALREVCQKDKGFAEYYENLQSLLVYFDDEDKSNYNDITYRSFYKLYQYSYDESVQEPLQTKWSREWKKLYGATDHQADSLLSYWRAFQKKNSLERLVKVEFVGIHREEGSSEGWAVPAFEFRLTPQKGKVDNVEFTYCYQTRFIGGEQRCYCQISAPLVKSTVKRWDLDQKEIVEFGKMTTDEILKQYNIKVVVTSARKDGRTYSLEDMGIPKIILRFLNTSLTPDSDEYQTLYGNMVRATIDKNYLTEAEYIQERSMQDLRERFPKDVVLISHLYDNISSLISGE